MIVYHIYIYIYIELYHFNHTHSCIQVNITTHLKYKQIIPEH